MTANHLLLYRLAELMLAEQQHQLSVDCLFEDEQIGEFVKSIQIDSPYQHMILEGVLTETIKEDKLFVTFTVEGYFHFVLGEVIFNHSLGKDPEFLKDIIENNKLNGAQEGVEQCLIRDVKQDDLSRLMWLIDQNEKTLNCSVIPLVNAFVKYPDGVEDKLDAKQIYRNHSFSTLQKIFENPTDSDIRALIKSINILRLNKKQLLIESIFLGINDLILPDTMDKAFLCVEAIDFLPKLVRKEKLLKLMDLILDFSLNQKTMFLMVRICERFFSISEFELSIKCLDFVFKSAKKNLDADDQIFLTCNSFYASLYDRLGDYSKAIRYQQKALKSSIQKHGHYHQYTSLYFRNLGAHYSHAENWSKSIENYKKSIEIERVLRGEFDENIAHSFVSLAVVYRNMEKYDDAINLVNAGLKVYKEIFGDSHSITGTALNNLGMIYYSMNDYENSIVLIEASLNITLTNNGFINHNTATSFNNLGLIKSALGQYDEALSNFIHSRNIKARLFGKNHVSIAHANFYIGETYSKKEDILNAIKSTKMALKNYSMNGVISYQVKCQVVVGHYFNQLKDTKKALMFFRKAWQNSMKAFGENHPRTAAIAQKISNLENQ